MKSTNLKHLAVASSVIALLSFSTATHAGELISAEEPEAILDIAKGFGSARLKKDSEGDPLISGRIDGTKYGVYFYGCNDKGTKCDDIKFGAGWSGYKISIDTINQWNKTKKYGVAYLDDDKDPNLDMVVNIDYGVSIENLEDSFNIWSKILKSYKKEVLSK